MKTRLLTSLLFFALPAFALGQTPDPVVFGDQNLEAAVAAATNEELGSVTVLGMEGIAELDISNSGITNLTGLENATNLTYLNLSHNSVSSITPLKDLPLLNTLEIRNNQVQSIADLETGFQALVTLNLNFNAVSDISILIDSTDSTLTHPTLTYLYLNDNFLDTRSGSQTLSNLQSLSSQLAELSYLRQKGLKSLAPLTTIPTFPEFDYLSPVPTGGTIVALAKSDTGRHLALQAAGQLRFSDDSGASWIDGPMIGSGNNSYEDITFGDGVFTVIGTDGIFESNDNGYTWSHIQVDDSWALRRVQNANGATIAVGYGGRVWAKNGAAWTQVQLGVDDDQLTFSSVIFADGNWIAGTHGGGILRLQNPADLSSAWEAQAMPSTGPVRDFATNGSGLIIAVTEGERSFASSDAGANWTETGPTSGAWSPSVTWDISSGYFFVTGGNLGRSTDGISWEMGLHNDFTFEQNTWLSDIESDPLIAAGWGGQIIRSSDSVLWENVGSVNAFNGLNDVRYLNGNFVTVGSEGAIYTSEEGDNWTRSYLNEGHWLQFVTFGNGLYLASDGDTAFLSDDLEHWSGQSFDFGSDRPAHSAAYGDGVFVLAGPNGMLFTSPDGQIWTDHSIATSDRFNNVTYGAGRFIAVGTNNTTYTSIDSGATWSSIDIGAPYNISDVYYSTEKGVFVAAGEDFIKQSSDGINWTTIDTGNFGTWWHRISAGNGFWVISDGWRAIYSSDLIHWDEFRPGNGASISGIAMGEDRILLSGDGGTLMVSQIGEPEFLIGGDSSQFSLEGDPIAVTAGVVAESGATYQWYKDGAVVPDGNGQQLLLGAALASDSGIYRLEVTHDGGVATSPEIGLSVFANEAVNLDPALDAAVRERFAALNILVGGTLFVEDMLKLDIIYADGYGVESLTGLEYAGNLRELHLWNGNSNASVTDLAPISNLTNLVRLNLESNQQLGDISLLVGLINLDHLNASDTGIDNISALTQMAKLRELIAWGNDIEDLAPLSGLSELSYVDLGRNNISSIAPLAALPKVDIIYIYDNQVASIASLNNGFPSLTYLSLDRNAIEDVSAAIGHPSLDALRLNDNFLDTRSGSSDLADLTVLSGELTELVYLRQKSQKTLEADLPLPVFPEFDYISPLPSGGSIKALAQSDTGRYIALTAGGALLFSDDSGVSWDEGPSLDIGRAWDQDITFGAGVFTIVGTNGIFESNDNGANWTHSTVSQSWALRRVHAADGKVVAVGNGARVWGKSGGAWTQYQAPPVDGWSYSFRALFFADGAWMAGNNSGVFYRPTDPADPTTEWVPQNVTPNDLTREIQDITSNGNGLLVAVAEDDRSFVSTDAGANWTEGDRIWGAWAPSVAWDSVSNRFFVAGGNNLGRSVDGSVWEMGLQNGFLFEQTARMNDISGDPIIAVGEGRQIIRSLDGLNWEDVGSDNAFYSLRRIRYLNGKFVTVGTDGAIYVSENGETWNRSFLNEGNWLEFITYGNGLYLAGDGNNIYRSNDLLNWSGGYVHFGDNNWLTDATFGNGTFVLAGGNGTLFTTPDGESWDNKTIDGVGSFHSIAYGANRFIAVGDNNLAYTSEDDGATWTSLDLGAPESIYGIHYSTSKGLFVAVGGNFAKQSAGGISWTDIDTGGFGTYWDKVTEGEGFWILVNHNQAIYSSDLIHWAEFFPGDGEWLGAAAIAEGKALFSGDGGSLLISQIGAPQFLMGGDSSQFTLDGGDITLSTGVVGGSGAAYQWYKDGIEVTGETNQQFLLSPAGADDSGTYVLEVTYDETSVVNSPSITLEIWANVEVNFPDPILEGVVRARLGIPTDPILVADMLNLDQVLANGEGITDLSGLQWARNLTHLKASGGSFSDLSPIQELSKLKQLDISLNTAGLPNLDSLQGLALLERLWANSSGVYDVSALASISKLTHIFLDYSEDLSDVSALGYHPNLRVANLRYCKIESIAGFENLTNLQYLRLHGNYKLSGLSPISGQTTLRHLLLNDTSVSSLSVLDPSKLSNLQQLQISNTNISDISMIAGLTKLTHLRIADLELIDADTSILGNGNFNNLTQLYVGGNNITDYSFLSGMSKLQRLYIDNHNFDTTEKLQGLVDIVKSLPTLQRLYLRDGPISNGDPFADLYLLPQLQYLWVRGNSLSDLSPFSGLHQVQNFSINTNLIEDLSPLVNGMNSLSVLNAHSNLLSDDDLDDIQALIDRGIDVQTFAQQSGIDLVDDLKDALESIWGTEATTLPGALQFEETFEGLSMTLASLSGSAGDTISKPFQLNAPLDRNWQVEVTVSIGREEIGLPSQVDVPNLEEATIGLTLVNRGNTQDRAILESGFRSESDANGIEKTMRRIRLVSESSLSTYENGDRNKDLHNKPANIQLTLVWNASTRELFAGAHAGNQRIFEVSPIPLIEDWDFSTSDGFELYLSGYANTDAQLFPGDLVASDFKTSNIATEIVFPDSNLETAIANALGKPGESLTDLDMLHLTYLDISNSGITNLGGLEWATNLDNLNAWGNPLEDIAALSNLHNLWKIDIGGAGLSDLSPLSGLTNLWELHAWGNAIEDLTPIADLTNLRFLNLDENRTLGDISLLSSLTYLERLYVGETGIDSLLPVANLTNLWDLRAWNNDIEDLAPLSNLTNLSHLFISQNNISSIAPLATLPNLASIDIWHNQVESIDTLNGGFSALSYLSLDRNAIDDVSAAIGHPTLDGLRLNDNFLDTRSGSSDLSDLQTLGGILTELTYLRQKGLKTLNANLPLPSFPSFDYVTPTPIGGSIKAVARGEAIVLPATPARAIALMGGGQLLFSDDDGASWSNGPSLDIGDVWNEDIAYDAGVFTIVGTNGIFESSDNGETWSQTPVNASWALRRVHAANGTVVAVGHGGRIWVKDGGAWTFYQSTPTGWDYQFNAILFADGAWMAGNNSGDIYRPTVSSDPSTPWIPIGMPIESTREIMNFASNGSGRIIAVAEGDRSFVSDDAGATWSNGGEISGAWGPSVTWDSNSNQFFVTGGNSGRSTNGLEWEMGLQNNFLFEQSTWMNGISSNPLIAVGEGGQIIRSLNGDDWENVGSVNATHRLNDVQYLNGKFVAVGTDGAAYVSSDAETWERTFLNDGHWFEFVTYGNGLYLTSDGGNVYVSDDLVHWSGGYVDFTTDTHPDVWGHAAAFGDGVFAMAGRNGMLVTSPDGKNWTDHSISTSNNFNSIAYGAGRFIAVGANNLSYTSSDGGLSWSGIDLGAQANIAAINYSSEKEHFIAAGNNFVKQSSDGLTWTDIDTAGLGTSWYSITQGDDFWILSNGNRSIYSSDLIHWGEFTAGHGEWMPGVAIGQDKVLLSGTGGSLLVSQLGSPQFLMGDSISELHISGGDILLSTGVVGGTGSAYQWYKDGVVLDGETGQQLLLPATTATETGSYYLEVTYDGGLATSPFIDLEVLDNVEIAIPDAALEGVIRARLGIPLEPILVSDMLALDQVRANNKGVSNLSGLEHARNLTRLDVNAGSFSDLSPIQGLVKIKRLDIRYNTAGLPSLDAISGMLDLYDLRARDSGVSDISALAGLSNLTFIDVAFSPDLHDISALASHSKLKTINLQFCRITDLSPLANLELVQLLRLQGNYNLADLSPISAYSVLRHLIINSTSVSSLESISTQQADTSWDVNFSTLTNLSLSNTYITDITPISGLTNLTNLQISKLGLADADVAFLSNGNFNNLTTFSIGGNELTHYGFLSGMTQLTKLIMQSHNLDTLAKLQGVVDLAKTMPDLQRLVLTSGSILDPSPLAELSVLGNLTDLWVPNNLITNLSAFYGLNQITDLRINSNRIESLSPLIGGMPSLATLNITWNLLSDDDGADIQTLTTNGVTVTTVPSALPTAVLDDLNDNLDLALWGTESNTLPGTLQLAESPSGLSLTLNGSANGDIITRPMLLNVPLDSDWQAGLTVTAHTESIGLPSRAGVPNLEEATMGLTLVNKGNPVDRAILETGYRSEILASGGEKTMRRMRFRMENSLTTYEQDDRFMDIDNRELDVDLILAWDASERALRAVGRGFSSYLLLDEEWDLSSGEGFEILLSAYANTDAPIVSGDLVATDFKTSRFISAITSHPEDQTITYNAFATLNVAALGADPAYEWYEGSSGDTSSGILGTEATFTTPALEESTSYWARISGVDSDTAIITVIPLPTITMPGSGTALLDKFYSIAITATDDPTSFGATGLPAGLSVDTATGLITGTPTDAAGGPFAVTVSATNTSGTTEADFLLTVQSPPPVITSSGTLSGQAGLPVVPYQITATYLPTSYGAVGLPEGLSVDPVTGVISGTPTAWGTFEATISAVNDSGTGYRSLYIAIYPPASLPVFNGSSQFVGTVGEPLTPDYTPSFTDATSFAWDATSQTLLNELGLSLSPAGTISGTPIQSGAYALSGTATGAGGSIGFSATALINPSQSAPTITSSSVANATVGDPFSSFQVEADSAVTRFVADGLPASFSMTDAGLITGTPTADEVGDYLVSLRAENANGLGQESILLLTINPSPDVPTITNETLFVSGLVGSPLSYSIQATGSADRYQLIGSLPSGLSVNLTTGVVSGTPLVSGTFVVSFAAVSDTVGTGPAVNLTIDIEPAANAPVMTNALEASGQVGEFFNLQLTAINDPTSFSVIGALPGGLSFDAIIGLISGIPQNVGETRILVSASNGSATGDSIELLISIAPASSTPEITSSANAYAQVGTPFGYQLTGSESPNSYVVVGTLPTGLSLDPVTGLISGIPGNETAGDHVITIKAANAVGFGSEFEINLLIVPNPNAPEIVSSSSVAGSVNVPFAYSIDLVQTGTYAYFIEGVLPVGLSLNSSTGVISGTPVAAETSIVAMTVVDANGLQSLPQELTITIQPSADAPVVISTLSAFGSVGESFSYAVEADIGTGSSVDTYYAVGLPSGLSVNPTTGLVSGTPLVSGTFDVLLSAQNGEGLGDEKALRLVISPAANAPIISSVNAVSAQAGSGFSYEVEALNNPTSFSVSNMPSWMSVDGATGMITGVPFIPAEVNVSISASNAAGTSVAVNLTIAIASAPNAPVVNIQTGNIAEATLGSPMADVQLDAILDLSTTFDSFVASGLPAGVSLDSASGLISGTPIESGVFDVEVRALADDGNSLVSSLPIILKIHVNGTLPFIIQ